MRLGIVFSIGLIVFALTGQSQTSGGMGKRDPDALKTIAEVEMELMPLTGRIMNGTSTEEKYHANNEFAPRLVQLLKRPESFDYPFDSLKTISILKPKDNTFRIFTWVVTEVESDTSRSLYDKHHSHSYFGLVQRKYVQSSGKEEIIVIGLREGGDLPRTREGMVTDQNNWFGALYYRPKHQEELLAYDGHCYEAVPKSGKKNDSEIQKTKTTTTITFVPGNFKKRMLTETERPLIKTHKWEKKDVRYYLLTGWNGWGTESNYKVVECMYFDPEDSTHVVFGAPVFFFESIPKSRVLFKYSENAPFSLNTGEVRRGLFGILKENMIVFDHIAEPHATKEMNMYWELGPDGTTDALWFQKRLGVFMWIKDVEVVSESPGKQSVKELKRQFRIHERQAKKAKRTDPSAQPLFYE